MSGPSQRKRRSHRSKSQKRQRQQRRNRRQRGGDASNWASAVYGPAGSHTAIPGSGNLIAANNLSGVNMCSGSVATNAMPVVGGGVLPGTHANIALSGPAAPPGAAAATNQMPQMDVPGMSKGGNRCNQRGGKGILTDVAVPAVLLYANHMIKPRKSATSKTHKKRGHFSRKFRRY